MNKKLLFNNKKKVDNLVAEYTYTGTNEVLPTFTPTDFAYAVEDITNDDGSTTRKLRSSNNKFPRGMSFYGKTTLTDVSYYKVTANDGTTTTAVHSSIFQNCTNLISCNLSASNFTGITSFDSVFRGCSSLETVDITGIDTSLVKSFASLFQGCNKLTTIKGIEDLDTSSLTGINLMFTGCIVLTSLDLHKWNTSKLSNLSQAFSSCPKLITINTTGWDVSKFDNLMNVFGSCIGLKNIIGIENWNITNALTNLEGAFSNCRAMKSFDFIQDWDVSNVTKMGSLFRDCQSITSLNLSNWNTARCVDMSNMFNGCTALQTLTLGNNFNTSKVTNMANMFKNVRKVTSIDVSNFNTSVCNDMQYMFSDCSALTSIDVSNFNTSVCTNMSNMFNINNSGLTELDLTSFVINSSASTTNMLLRLANNNITVKVSSLFGKTETECGYAGTFTVV